MNNQNILRQQLLQLLDGRNAHMTFDDAVAEFPVEMINARPPNVPYTFWHLVEHLRIAQWDIFDFIINRDYTSPNWPEGYWPDQSSTATHEEWDNTLAQFRKDRATLAEMIRDEKTDLMADLEHAPGYTIMREIIVVADHNAYHTGELAILRQVMSAWPQSKTGN